MLVRLLCYNNNYFNIPRKSKDETVNAFGLSLIDLCCEFDVHTNLMKNSMTLKGTSHISPSGCSVIDYAILSAHETGSLFCFSNHMPLSLTIETKLEDDYQRI